MSGPHSLPRRFFAYTKNFSVISSAHVKLFVGSFGTKRLCCGGAQFTDRFLPGGPKGSRQLYRATHSRHMSGPVFLIAATTERTNGHV
jgi:hypothetical protein